MMFASLPRPLLFAHRGASRHAPENTMPAFELGVASGAHVLELDVHLTRDGEVVVHHDTTLERTTNGAGLLAEHRYAELCALDAGARYRDVEGRAPFAERGVVIPRLRDVMAAFPAQGFNIEIKQESPNMVRSVLEILEAMGNDNVVLTAGNHTIMQQIERLAPEVTLGLSFSQCVEVLKGSYLGTIPQALRHRAMQIPPRTRLLPIATRRLIRAAHRADIEVHLWTINDAHEAQEWLAKGVDGIMSDDPGALRHLFKP